MQRTHPDAGGPSSGEQLDLFDAGQRDVAPAVERRAATTSPRAEAESNDMALVHEVLAAAERSGYFVTDAVERGPAGYWRAGSLTDTRIGTAVPAEAEPREAAMVAQLLERGWLHRAARARSRVVLRRGRFLRSSTDRGRGPRGERDRRRPERDGALVVSRCGPRPAHLHD